MAAPSASRGDLGARRATLIEDATGAHDLVRRSAEQHRPLDELGFPPNFDGDPGLGNSVYYYDQFLQHFGSGPYTSLPAVAPLISSTPDFLDFYNTLLGAYNAGNLQPNSAPPIQQYFAALKLLRQQYLEAWMQESAIDAFVCPTAKIPAFKQLTDPGIDAFGDTLNARFESNILGLPAITVPMGFYSNGVPGTLQFVGDFYGEAEIIGFAYDYEQATLHRMKPRLRAARRQRECPDLPGGRCAK